MDGNVIGELSNIKYDVNKTITLRDLLPDSLLMTLYPQLSDISVTFINKDYNGLPNEIDKELFFRDYEGLYRKEEGKIFIKKLFNQDK